MTDARERGWGPGYPVDRSADMVRLQMEGTEFPAGVHALIAELASIMLEVSIGEGWLRLHPGWCWGYSNRPIKLPSGGFSTTPSNHSWGLALDINAPENPFGGTSHAIPEVMGNFWERYGFRWGGHYSGTRDWMHLEYLGTPAQAATHTQKARDLVLSADQKLDLEWLAGFHAFFKGEKVPRKPGPKRTGWRNAERSVNEPKPK
jgi:hypothetical protein